MTAAATDVKERLTRFLTAQLDGEHDLRIDGLQRVTVGTSRENWLLDASWDGDRGRVCESLILRRDPVGSVLETDRRAEVAILRALETTPVPAPRLRWADVDGEWLGRPSVIMTREQGICDYYVLTGERPVDARLAVAHRFSDLLVAIHAVDWAALGMDRFLPDPGERASLTELDTWQAILKRHQLEPFPELVVVASWLRDHAPAAPATVLVHGDFKPGNALMRGDEIGAMLDWEMAHLGDPVEDLGWITNPVRRREHQIPGVWEREQIVSRYVALTGRDVSDASLLWWNVFACFKLAIIVVTGIKAFVVGRLDRIYHAPISLCRVMFDLIGA